MFGDVKPIAQDDGPEPVVRIAYAPDFEVAMGYFRRVLVDGEFSKRSLLLSAEVIGHNAANYTAWQYRRRCIREMHAASTPAADAQWAAELLYSTEQCLGNMKNYQVWFHRRACVEAIGAAPGELDFVARVLEEDSKNYHAWGHRQWVLRTFGEWGEELAYTDRLLDADVRNNSAWNQRHFVLKNTADLADAAALAPEVGLALKHIADAPGNASPWAYIKGLVEPVGYGHFPQLRASCEKLAVGEGCEKGQPCVNALSMLVDVLRASGDAAEAERARSVCAQLRELDAIRARYWQWRGDN